jgi:hypothetical protein
LSVIALSFSFPAYKAKQRLLTQADAIKANIQDSAISRHAPELKENTALVSVHSNLVFITPPHIANDYR